MSCKPTQRRITHAPRQVAEGPALSEVEGTVCGKGKVTPAARRGATAIYARVPEIHSMPITSSL